MTRTLAIDCGGTGLKGSVLDDDGAMVADRVRVRTPYPLPPERLVAELQGIAAGLPSFDRVTVGLPGMIRHGIVIATPHYVCPKGPFSKPDTELQAQWFGFDVRAAVEAAFERPARVLNDAEVAAAAVVSGRGYELMLTLGTGLGMALYEDGRLMPKLELSQATIRRGVTYDRWIGNHVRKEIGYPAWSRRIREMVTGLRPVFLWDRLYLGGGNAQRLDTGVQAMLGPDVSVVPNSAGITGGVRVWDRVV